MTLQIPPPGTLGDMVPKGGAFGPLVESENRLRATMAQTGAVFVENISTAFALLEAAQAENRQLRQERVKIHGQKGAAATSQQKKIQQLECDISNLSRKVEQLEYRVQQLMFRPTKKKIQELLDGLYKTQMALDNHTHTLDYDSPAPPLTVSGPTCEYLSVCTGGPHVTHWFPKQPEKGTYEL